MYKEHIPTMHSLPLTFIAFFLYHFRHHSRTESRHFFSSKLDETDAEKLGNKVASRYAMIRIGRHAITKLRNCAIIATE